MKLPNWRLEYWHFNKYLISYTGVMKLLAYRIYSSVSRGL